LGLLFTLKTHREFFGGADHTCCCPLKSGQSFLGLTGRDELAG
jgi:hypothetical protein